MVFPVQLIHERAQLPTRGSTSAAGMDVYAVEDVLVPPGETVAVPLGIIVSCPLGSYARLAPRSGLAMRHSIQVLGGVVDSDYRGEVKVLLHNLHKSDTFKVSCGDRIAQMILELYLHETPRAVSYLRDTERGDAGFGSSGK